MLPSWPAERLQSMSLPHRRDLSLSDDLIYLNVTGDCWKAEKKLMYHQLMEGGDINLTSTSTEHYAEFENRNWEQSVSFLVVLGL